MTGYHVLEHRLDYAAMALLCVVTLLVTRTIRRRFTKDSLACYHVAIVSLFFLGAGFAVTELITQSRFREITAIYTEMMKNLASQKTLLGFSPAAALDEATLAKLQKNQQALLRQNKFIHDVAVYHVDPQNRTAVALLPRKALPPAALSQPAPCTGAMLAAAVRNPERPSAELIKFAEYAEVTGGIYYPIDPAIDSPKSIAALYVSGKSWISSLLNIRLLTIIALYSTYLLYLVGTTMLCLNKAEIRQRRQAEEELRRARDAADEANRAKSEFLAVMSHEIRTPLTAVIGFNNILAETSLNEVQRRYVNNIQSASERLTHLLGDVLDFSKIEDRKVILENLPYQPMAVIAEVIDMLAIRAGEKKLTLVHDTEVDPALTLEGDASRFRQVVINLVTNALKFTDQGGITVRTRWRPPSRNSRLGQLGVEVIDTGVGIAASQMGNLFNMFVQVQPGNHRRYGGSGLGLAICKRLIELMGGTITVESTLGEGTRFAFNLPATLHLDSTASHPAGHESSPSQTSPDLPPKKALIVEDHPMNRELLKLILRRQGFESDLATNGHEAISLARSTHYDVIFMDIEMPDRDGYAATRDIRRQEKPGQRALIIAVTAITLVGTREKCINAGMDDYLTKPVYLPALKNVLAAHHLLTPPPSTPPGRASRSPLTPPAPAT